MFDIDSEGTQEIWVSATEGGEITGYTRNYVQKLARDNWNLPEDQRLIRVRKRRRGYDIWLPDLFNYISKHGNGPLPRSLSDT
jgi:hypothetical protein